MKFYSKYLLALMVAGGVITSCSSDSINPAAGESDFQSLSTREDVITSIVYGYRQEDLDAITRALDEVFSFCYTSEFNTTCWGRDDDLLATERLFQPAVIPPESTPITHVEIALSIPPGWVSSTPPDPNRYAGVTFWEKTVDYVVLITRDGETVPWGPGGRATFIIRGVTIDHRGQWRLFGIADHSGYWGALKAAFAEAKKKE